MKKERKDKDFIKSAYYPGGKSALEAFVKKELRYPKEALKAKVEGTVSVRYTVDYKGLVIEASVISSLGHGCDEEALRIVRKLKFDVPEDGRIKSKFTRKLHIHFRLPGSPEKSPATKPAGGFQIQYEVKSKTDKPVTGSGSYQYTISIPPKKPT